MAERLESIKPADIDLARCCFNPGCAMSMCKPQVHEAIRSLLRKMNVTVAESEFSREKSVCCGDVVVTCISCIRSMTVGGKRARYLPDVIFGRATPPMTDSLTDYHDRLEAYIAAH